MGGSSDRKRESFGACCEMGGCVGVYVHSSARTLSKSARYALACRNLQGSDNGGKRLSVVCEERFVLLAAKLVVEMGGNMSFLIHGAPQSNVRVLIGNAHSRRKSIMTVLSCNARGGLKLLSLRAGTRPLGENSKSSAGFLYGSTSSAIDVSIVCMSWKRDRRDSRCGRFSTRTGSCPTHSTTINMSINNFGVHSENIVRTL